MSITLHYKGTLKSPEYIDEIIEEMIDIAKTKEWDYTILDDSIELLDDLGDFEEDFEDEEEDLLDLRGILIVPNECEPISLTFMPDGRLISPLISIFPNEKIKEFLADDDHYAFSKTQHAGIDIHVEVVKLLKYLSKKYFKTWDCIDDSGYYETGDQEKLEKIMDTVDKAMNALNDAFAMHGDKFDEANPEEMVDFIKNVLQAEDVDIKLIKTNLGEEIEDERGDEIMKKNQQVQKDIDDILDLLEDSDFDNLEDEFGDE